MISAHKPMRPRSPTSCPIRQTAQWLLSESVLFQGQGNRVQINFFDGQLILDGRLPSFYLRQMLEMLMREIAGVRSIENRAVMSYEIYH